MKAFSVFLSEQKNKGMSLTSRQFDFLGHLMSPFDDKTKIKNGRLTEEKENVSPSDIIGKTVPHQGQDVLIHGPNMLRHPAIKGTGNSEEATRYLNLMRRGNSIASKLSTGVHKHIQNGFEQYSKRLAPGYDPRQDPRLSEAKAALQNSYREAGFKAQTAPKWLSGNTKTEKNEKLGDISANLTLAPARLSNIGKHTACAKATTECEYGCLGHSAGQNSLLSAINSKIAKHHFFAQHPEHSAHMIHGELLDHVDQVAEYNKERKRKKLPPLEASVRMNVVSDFNFNKMNRPMLEHITEYAKRKGVKFTHRDYTKHPERLYQARPENSYLALSHTGANHSESNDSDVSEALSKGQTVAAVIHGNATHFYDHKTKRLYPIDDGDSDDRIEDGHKNVGHTVKYENGIHVGYNKNGQKEGVIRGLRIKGSTNEMKEAAGNFVSPTTTIKHSDGNSYNVVEINKPK